MSFLVRCTKDFHTLLKLFCVENSISMKDFVLQAIEEKLKREMGKK